jgi:hypothetical protein
MIAAAIRHTMPSITRRGEDKEHGSSVFGSFDVEDA